MLNDKRLVIVRLSSIGDVLHCTPVARNLKKYAPSCHLTWVVGQVSAEIVQDNPFIDEVYIWPRERWEACMRQGKLREAWNIWRQLKRDMLHKKFDIALDVHGLLLSGMVTKSIGAPRRIGLSGTKEPNGLFMTEKAPLLSGDIHVIQKYLSILRPLGINSYDYKMTLCLPEKYKDFAKNFLLERGVKENEKLIIINPATTWRAKNWPPEHFAEVADELSGEGRVIICGSPADRDIARQIVNASAAPLINAVGQTSLMEMAALLERASVVVVGDTGPLHMAVALGTPTVSIFGATDPARFGPLTPGHIILSGQEECSPCHKTVCPKKDMRCMHGIKPATVIKAVYRQLNTNSRQILRSRGKRGLPHCN